MITKKTFLMREVEAAKYLTVSQKTLQTYRRLGKGPEFYKVGRSILYSESALLKWLETKRHTSTSEYFLSARGA